MAFALVKVEVKPDGVNIDIKLTSCALRPNHDDYMNSVNVNGNTFYRFFQLESGRYTRQELQLILNYVTNNLLHNHVKRTN